MPTLNWLAQDLSAITVVSVATAGWRPNDRLWYAAWVKRVAKFLQDGRRRGARRPVLAGYSRGGSAAMMAAQILNKLGLRVDAMLLFDPVARHASEGREIVPGNVALP